MKQVYTKTTLCFTALMSIGSALPAVAQQRNPGATSILEKVIVTARRREERLQDVPISVAVFDQSQLDDRNITSVADLAAYVPSLSAESQFGPDFTNFTIRGFTRETRTAAAVGVYFAAVPAPRGNLQIFGGDGSGPGYFFDLQNVQVLRGPQGTLFGRNVTGGNILFVPKKPSDEFQADVEGSAGDYDMYGVQGVLNVPLHDRVRLRVGFDQQKRDGYLENYSGIGPDHYGDIDYIAGRASRGRRQQGRLAAHHRCLTVGAPVDSNQLPADETAGIRSQIAHGHHMSIGQRFLHQTKPAISPGKLSA